MVSDFFFNFWEDAGLGRELMVLAKYLLACCSGGKLVLLLLLSYVIRMGMLNVVCLAKRSRVTFFIITFLLGQLLLGFSRLGIVW